MTCILSSEDKQVCVRMWTMDTMSIDRPERETPHRKVRPRGPTQFFASGFCTSTRRQQSGHLPDYLLGTSSFLSYLKSNSRQSWVPEEEAQASAAVGLVAEAQEVPVEEAEAEGEAALHQVAADLTATAWLMSKLRENEQPMISVVNEFSGRKNRNLGKTLKMRSAWMTLLKMSRATVRSQQ